MSVEWRLLNYRDEREQANAVLAEIARLNPGLPAANRFEFIDALATHLMPSSEFYLAVAFENERVKLALPLVPTQRQKYGWRWRELCTPYTSHAALYALPNCSDDEIDDLLASLLKQAEAWPIKWQRLAIRLVMTQTTHPTFEYAGDSAWFRWAHGAEINKIMSNKLYKNLLRLRKRLEEKTSTPTLHLSDANSFQHDLRDFCALESKGWRGKQDATIAGAANTLAFYQTMMQSFADNRQAFVYRLVANNQLLAAAIGFEFDDTVYLQAITFDEAHAECAVGSQLVLDILQHYLHRPAVKQLSLTTCPDWCRRWHPQHSAVYNLTGYRHQFLGAFLKWLVPHWRQFKEYVRPLHNRWRGQRPPLPSADST
jgi:hypothetical protein